MPTDHHAAFRSIMPPADTDARRDFLKAAMDEMVDALWEHSDRDKHDALIGFRLFVLHGIERLNAKKTSDAEFFGDHLMRRLESPRES